MAKILKTESDTPHIKGTNIRNPLHYIYDMLPYDEQMEKLGGTIKRYNRSDPKGKNSVHWKD
jgi:hypothetical protein